MQGYHYGQRRAQTTTIIARTARRSLLAVAASAGVAAYLILAAAGGATLSAVVCAAPGGAAARRALAQPMVIAQNDHEVSSADVEKYVAVYSAMQHNHSLSVEQAAAAQGLTLRAFRELEQRIERDDVARDQARRALARSAAQPAPSPRSSTHGAQP